MSHSGPDLGDEAAVGPEPTDVNGPVEPTEDDLAHEGPVTWVSFDELPVITLDEAVWGFDEDTGTFFRRPILAVYRIRLTKLRARCNRLLRLCWPPF